MGLCSSLHLNIICGHRLYQLSLKTSCYNHVYSMNKIVIIGCPASGKTTLATTLGEILDIPVYHLDKIFWVKKGGIKQDLFLEEQENIMKNEKWILDGNFMRSTSYDVRLSKADTIIFFKFSKILIYWRLFKRFIKFFNKKRPDMSGDNLFHIDWHIIKFIWNYPTEDEYSRLLSYLGTKKVFVLKNNKDEIEFLSQFR
jgi:adenylate kinase family enzyme